MKHFKYRVGNLEVRSADKYLMQAGEHVKAEIILWHTDNKSCHTVASWQRDSEGFNLHFVGNRPFKVEELYFFQLAKVGQDHLDKYYKEMEEDE